MSNDYINDAMQDYNEYQAMQYEEKIKFQKEIFENKKEKDLKNGAN